MFHISGPGHGRLSVCHQDNVSGLQDPLGAGETVFPKVRQVFDMDENEQPLARVRRHVREPLEAK
jgi:hypothetical protein